MKDAFIAKANFRRKLWVARRKGDRIPEHREVPLVEKIHIVFAKSGKFAEILRNAANRNVIRSSVKSNERPDEATFGSVPEQLRRVRSRLF